MKRVSRVDVGQRIRADMRTAQGSARIPVNFTRTGVFIYRQEDGSERREYRPPSEVFAPDSLKSLETAVVTDGHPGTVTPDNWRELAMGDVRDPHRDGIFVAGAIVVRDKGILGRVDTGDLRELSCGYDCFVTMEPGVTPDGERYDARQSAIVYNHVGLGPANWGRAGSDVRLKLDGGMISYRADESDRLDTKPPVMDWEKLFKDLQAKHDALIADHAKEKARADGLQQAADKARTDGGSELVRVTAERDSLKAKVDGLEKQTDPARIDGLVRTRVAVIDGARLLHGKVDVALEHADKKPKSDREVMIEGIVAREADFKADGQSDDYVRARFDFAVEQAKKAGASLANLNGGTSPHRLDAGGGGGDTELATLIKRFDSAPDRLETYVRAEPWRIGEENATAIAAEVGG